jgi:hypothetical protein
MALQILVQYRNQPVSYNVDKEEDNIYRLCLNRDRVNRRNEEYIPEKIVIRKKGMIWISDMDNYDELVNALTREIISFNKEAE